MGRFNLAYSKRNPKQWRLLDIISAGLLAAVLLFFLLVFTPLGGSGIARSSGSGSDPRQRARMVALLESGSQEEAVEIDPCSPDMVDHMPCEDPKINSQLSREMNYYRERHCPKPENTPLCLIPPTKGYRIPVHWPESLHKIWHDNMPYNKIADRKGHQGWMKKEGQYFIFPGGGTMFPDGAVQYIEKLKQYIPIAGGVLRTALDMGCGVASFGGYMHAEDILTVSFAPRDSHKSQIQFALERGIPALVAMLGTRRLPFPGFSFDLVHCSRCLIPFTAYNATYFLEVDRLLRPGGYLVISGPPVQWHKQEKEWDDLQLVARLLCYKLIVVDGNTAIWKKRNGDSCNLHQKDIYFSLCDESDNSNAAWYFKLKRCVSRMSSVKGRYAIGTIPEWPERLIKAPSRFTIMERKIDEFESDSRRWERTVAYYKRSLKIKLGSSSIRNVMDMNAFFGGFAAALITDPVWVMNVVPSLKPYGLDVIYDRGLIGIYHDWCEPFSTYPRTYDFIHAVSIESLTKHPVTGKSRCNLVDLMVEMDRILRPEGLAVIRDKSEVIDKVDWIARAIRWKASIHDTEPDLHRDEKILVGRKIFWKI